MSWSLAIVKFTARVLGIAVTQLIDWEDIDVAEYIDPVEYVDWDALDYEDLEEHLDERHYRDPLETLEELPDEDGRIYYWECETEEAAGQVTDILESYFDRELGRNPNAAHLVLTDVEQLREMDPDELRVYTQPFGGDD